jgi:hypothetical protein
VQPFPVVFTGGVSPGLWKPIPSIDAIKTQPYAIDLSPFIGTLTDGKAHKIELVPPKAITDHWTLDANLFATVDPNVAQVTGTLTSTDVPAAMVTETTFGTDTVNDMRTTAKRQWRTLGIVYTSQGKVHVSAGASWNFRNSDSTDSTGVTTVNQHADGNYFATRQMDYQPPTTQLTQFDFTIYNKGSFTETDDSNYVANEELYTTRFLRDSTNGVATALSDIRNRATSHLVVTGGSATTNTGTAWQTYTGLDDLGRWYHRRIAAVDGAVT